jgi:hypothetical protein
MRPIGQRLFALVANVGQPQGHPASTRPPPGSRSARLRQSPAAPAGAGRLADDAAKCDAMLAEASSRVRLGQIDAHLSALIFFVSEILDNLDTVLVGRHPLRDAPDFATVACLHRDLEAVQSAVPPMKRTRPPPEIRAQLAAMGSATGQPPFGNRR